jgi:hypothetical protein
VPTLRNLTMEQWIEQYRILTEKNRALLKGGLNDKQPAEPAAGNPETEHSDGREHSADRKGRRVGPKKPEPRTGKREALASGHSRPTRWQGRSRDPPYLLPGDSNWTFAKTPLIALWAARP